MVEFSCRVKMKKLISAHSRVLGILARPARLERATCGFVVRRSIQLSYGRMILLRKILETSNW
jgi:hypothetical protein